MFSFYLFLFVFLIQKNHPLETKAFIFRIQVSQIVWLNAKFGAVVSQALSF